MKRAHLAFAAVFLGSLLWVSLPATHAGNVTSRTGKVNPAALREMLVKGLKATREEEKLYIDLVVYMVMLEKLPVSSVYASFDYARKRRPSYPFPYFHYSIKTLSKNRKLGL